MLSSTTKDAGVIVYDQVTSDTVKVNGITKAQIVTHQVDIKFHT